MTQQNVKLVGHGFVPSAITEDQYILGASNALPFEVIQDNGNWTPYLPEGERQARLYFDTYGCTIYNTTAPIETLERKLFGEDSEYSERFVYIGTGTRPPGNNPHVICEWIRKNGLIPESLLPFTDRLQSLDEYASPNPLTMQYTDEGKKWLSQKSFQHEWVATDKHDPKETQARLKEALRTSPISVSVVAWQEHNGIYVKEQGQPDNHWAFLTVFDGNYPIILDSYPPYIKRLMPFYDFTYAKRYRVTKLNPQPKRSWFSFIGVYFPNLCSNSS